MDNCFSNQERVAIVDEKNRVTGAAPRAEMRRLNLIHRATYILVFNSAGELFIHKRTAFKDLYPGHYDVAAGGVVLAGEEYEEGVRRELEEELGISGVRLTRLFDFYHSSENNRVWGMVFSCIYDGPMVFQAEEVESGCFMKMEQVLQMMETRPFTPDGVMVLRRYLDLSAQGVSGGSLFNDTSRYVRPG